MSDIRFQSSSRMQATLMPECIDDWLPEDHLARFISEIVDSLDLKKIYAKYRNKGTRAYAPRMLLALMIYGYTQGVFSSRKLEAATYDSVAFRFLSGNMHPDHDTIANFRKRFLAEFEDCFKQVLLIAHEMGLVKVGNVYIDGTKVKANASKHKCMSYKYMTALMETLEAEIAALMIEATKADEREEEVEIPKEIKRREDRLEKLKAAKEELEARARERDKQEQAEYEKKLKPWKEKEKKRKRRGPKPQPPKDKGPRDKDQISFTDKESRIMKTGDGFQQCFNAQAAVTENRLIVGQLVNNHGNDYGEMIPALDAIQPELGVVENAIADNGYLSESNMLGCKERGVTPYVSLGREKVPTPIDEKSPTERELPLTELQKRMSTDDGRELYRKRKFMVEPVFGVIKEVMGFRRFSLRGEANVQGEWGLVCLAYNLKKIFKLKGGGTSQKTSQPIKEKRDTAKIRISLARFYCWMFNYPSQLAA